MSGGWMVALEAILVLGLFYGFCWQQMRFLKRDKAKREAERRQQANEQQV